MNQPAPEGTVQAAQAQEDWAQGDQEAGGAVPLLELDPHGTSLHP